MSSIKTTMDNQILNVILKETYTTLQLKHRLRIFKDYLTSQLFVSPAPLPQKEIPPQDLAWLSSLGEGTYKQFNKDNVYKILSLIEEQAGKITSLVIYLPFELDDSSAGLIGQYMRKIFSQVYLLDVKFNPLLIAGCTLSFKGIYKDYSLRARIEEKKEEILESFKKFLRYDKEKI